MAASLDHLAQLKQRLTHTHMQRKKNQEKLRLNSQTMQLKLLQRSTLDYPQNVMIFMTCLTNIYTYWCKGAGGSRAATTSSQYDWPLKLQCPHHQTSPDISPCNPAPPLVVRNRWLHEALDRYAAALLDPADGEVCGHATDANGTIFLHTQTHMYITLMQGFFIGLGVPKHS